MAWRASPPALIAAFDAALPDDTRVARKKMFGYPAAFVNGNLFAGLFEDSVALRLPEDARAALAISGGLPFAPMKGRVMREYMVPPAALVADRAALADWLARAFAFGLSLRPKTAKPATRKPAKISAQGRRSAR